jgi:orotate phosphoribosyltransferase
MRELMTKMVSLILWELGAIRISLDKPFKLTSGNYSPIYINCRRVISDAATMDLVAAFSHWIFQDEGIHFSMVAGGETAGIPFASFLAHRLAKPMVYVRKGAKGHGTEGLVEGFIKTGAKILLVEDLITDGQSKLSFIEPLRNEGATVQDCLVLFDRLQGGASVLEREGVRLISITDIDQSLSFAEASELVAPSAIAEVKAYLESPSLWHEARGLTYRTPDRGL